MRKLNNLTRFFIGFLLSYALISLIHFSGPIKKIHIHVFNTVEQMVFNLFHPTIRTNFKIYKRTPDMPPDLDNYDFSVYVYDKVKWKRSANKTIVKPRYILNQSSDLTSIGPLSLFLALLLVTPMSWKRKGFSFLLGSGIIFVFLALKFSYLLQENTNFDTTGYSLWGFFTGILGKAFRTHEFLLLSVVAVWAMVSLRVKEYKWFLE